MATVSENLTMARRLARAVQEKGGTAYFVGGFVRDRLRGVESKDIDIEVHGITVPCLEEILNNIGERISIGESFGIYGLRHYDIDIAMPRKEKLVGRGHRDFEVFVDPFVGTKKAALRRDFTVNALMQDVLTGEILDHFGGIEDLKNGILRHVNEESFAEDPLRVLRCAQFAARFSFSVHPTTTQLCRGISLADLSRERVAEELFKALNKAGEPSVFFMVLRECEQLDVWFPELKALIGVPQNPDFHAEGDVWNHTMLVLDEAAKLRIQANFPKYFMAAALVHDFGKALTTEIIDGKIHSYGHETEGCAPAEQFLRRLTDEKKLIGYVLNMTRLHMRPNILAAAASSIKKTNALFDDAVSPEDLLLLSAADDRGRISVYHTENGEAFLAERLRIYKEYIQRPAVTGEDLRRAGIVPGGSFSALLAFAHKLQLAGISKDAALKQTLARAKELNLYPNIKE